SNRHQHLKLACLPVPAQPRKPAFPKKDCLIIIAGTVLLVNTHFPFFPIFFLEEPGPSAP
ncbi:hypothetical protein, partial [uncultured Oscillibacter sp.]|uniref:hypothetical protein n=1 Tax=uncultured Oscillibacter sp. TaxID=876091 RepID=UPI002615A81F